MLSRSLTPRRLPSARGWRWLGTDADLHNALRPPFCVEGCERLKKFQHRETRPKHQFLLLIREFLLLIRAYHPDHNNRLSNSISVREA
jgi:hypothetical protein